jgi:hypothetical protein
MFPLVMHTEAGDFTANPSTGSPIRMVARFSSPRGRRERIVALKVRTVPYEAIHSIILRDLVAGETRDLFVTPQVEAGNFAAYTKNKNGAWVSTMGLGGLTSYPLLQDGDLVTVDVIRTTGDSKIGVEIALFLESE